VPTTRPAAEGERATWADRRERERPDRAGAGVAPVEGCVRADLDDADGDPRGVGGAQFYGLAFLMQE
jgi:hypothetical protein